MKHIIMAAALVPSLALATGSMSIRGGGSASFQLLQPGSDGSELWYSCRADGINNPVTAAAIDGCEGKANINLECDGETHEATGCDLGATPIITGAINTDTRDSPPGALIWELWAGTETVKMRTTGEQRMKVSAGCSAGILDVDLGTIMPGGTKTSTITVGTSYKGRTIVFSSGDMSHDGTIALGGDDALSVMPQDASAVADGKWIIHGPDQVFPIIIRAGDAVKPGRKISILTATMTCE